MKKQKYNEFILCYLQRFFLFFTHQENIFCGKFSRVLWALQIIKMNHILDYDQFQQEEYSLVALGETENFIDDQIEEVNRFLCFSDEIPAVSPQIIDLSTTGIC